MTEAKSKIAVDAATGAKIKSWLDASRPVYYLHCPDLSCLTRYFSPDRESLCPSHTIPYKGVVDAEVALSDLEIEPELKNSDKLYRRLATLVSAYHRCVETKNTLWEEKHEEEIERLVKNFLPSGSGFDSGTTIDIDASTGEKLVFTTSYHHMNDGGYYSGWTEHVVTVRASLQFDKDIKISGRDRNDIKDYIHEEFDRALGEVVKW